MSMEDFNIAMTNRSLRTVKAELQFLADSSVITHTELCAIQNKLPAERLLNNVPPTPRTRDEVVEPTTTLRYPSPRPQSTMNEKQDGFYNQPTVAVAPPPAYGPPTVSPLPAGVLTYAVAIYVYNATDYGDLNMLQHDRIAVSEYVNGEWWRGRNERDGQEGIFPRNYVRVVNDDKGMVAPPPQGGGYGNMPMDVSQGGAAPAVAEDPKKKGAASKIGGKLGNAAIFGAGATIGSNIVNSIF